MSPVTRALADERSLDAFLGGKVMLLQPRSGHRAGLDAALLQALIPSHVEGLAIDLGAGVGTVAFCLAARAEGLSVVGVERDAALVACGVDALELGENASFAKRVRLIEGDATDLHGIRERVGLGAQNADLVLMNPPFDPEGRVSESPDRHRRDAHLAAEGLVQSWSATAASLLKPGGMLGLIHRADALKDVLDALSRSFGDVRILPVHPTESARAIRVLVTARRASRSPLTLHPGLVLHTADGKWTARADALLRGQAELAL